MRRRLQARGTRKGDEHPTYTPLPSTFYTAASRVTPD